ncbi:MAG: type VI secretion system protein TssA [Pseudomonadota bacterium]
MADIRVSPFADLLQEISPEEPCGPNLEYDPSFLALEQAILGKPEVQYGDVITPAVPPEWKTVNKLTLELLGRSRDLRVAGPLLRSALALRGIVGLADGLQLVQQLLLERWDTVHPQLDPDDDLDPMLRINSLAVLAEMSTTIKEIKESPLVVLPGLGTFTLRDLDIALGELPAAEGVEKISVASISLAMHDLDPESFSKTFEGLKQAYDSVIGIEKILLQKVGASQTLNLDLLVKSLKRGRDFFADCQAQISGVGVVANDDEGVDSESASSVVARSTSGKPAISGEILTRDDVANMIEKICAYYQKYEPSSPVPLVLQRAKRLVRKNFFEIMEDLAPDGLHQVTMVAGASSSNEV